MNSAIEGCRYSSEVEGFNGVEGFGFFQCM
jgi:hypothetical protein